MLDMTIVDFLKDRAARHADALAFRFMDSGELDGPITEWTFAELYHQSIGVAQDLVEQGLGGSSVLLAFPPGLDFVKAFYGCLLAQVRAVPVPLPNPQSKNPLGRILNTARACEAALVLTTQELAEMAAMLGDELPLSFRAVSDRVAAAWHGPRIEMDTIAYLQFTSGSTGHPKGVAVSHANAVANLRVMGQMLRIKSTQPAIVWAPHYHDLCLVGHILGPVYYGFESTLMSPMDFLFKPVRWLRAISHYKVANTACPNFGYEYAARRIKPEECADLDLSHWRVAGNGGEPVLVPTMEKFTQKFEIYGFRPQTFMPTYGMAESVLFVAGMKELSEPPKVLTLSAPDLEKHTVRIMGENENTGRKVVSCGKPGYDHRIIAVDPESFTPANPDQVGELWVQGPSVPSAYWGLPEASAATFQGHLSETDEGPFLRTGDLGFVADGEAYVTGRLKDLIIVAGRNHYPGDIELTVQHSGAPVRLGSCAVISDSINGVEELIIIAEVDPRRLPPEDAAGSQMDVFWAESVKKVKGAVSEGHGLATRSVVFVEAKSLEKTSSGKLRRGYYGELLVKGELAVMYSDTK